MLPKVSVAMAVYNGRKYLFEQLKSIIDQSVSVDEIVIVDDCSLNKSDNIIREATKLFRGRVKYIENDTNIGYAQTFFKAIFETEGDIIFLADQDDVWESNKVELYLKYFSEREDIICLSSLNSLINSDGSVFKKEKKKKDKLSCIKTDSLIKQLWDSLRPGMTLAFRKTIKDLLLMMNLIKYESHDRLIEYIASIHEGYYLLNDYCTRYRIHSSNTSGINTSHFKLRSNIDGRIEQVNKEMRYLLTIKGINSNDSDIIDDQLAYYNTRKILLQKRSLILCLFHSLPLVIKYGKPKVLAGDILSIINK